jgi:protein phosphatase 4 regulatory subunit 3
MGDEQRATSSGGCQTGKVRTLRNFCVLSTEHSPRRLDARPWPTQNRALDAEEEDYFNADDDEDEDDIIPSISQHQWPRGSGAASPVLGMSFSLKRKRRMANAGPMGNRSVRPQNPTPPRSPLPSLVDYDDEEESPPKTNLSGGKEASSSSLPPSPKLAHRRVSPPSGPLLPSHPEEDEEDNMLEALINRARPQSPGPGLMASMDSLGPMRPGEKRRRSDDDDDDELLGRLSKSKKLDLGKQKEDSMAENAGSTRGTGKPNDEPPTKKFKLKLVASKPQETLHGPSEPGAKDGDTG